MVRSFISLLFLNLCLLLSAQEATISGIIKDNETQEVLPFTNITLSSNKCGTISNSEGQFSINVNNKELQDSITFSHLGYENLSIPIDTNTNHNILLTPRAINLSTVTIFSTPIDAESILDSLRSHFSKNSYKGNFQRQIFTRKNETVKMSDSPLILKKFKVKELERESMEKLLDNITVSNSYQDALVDFYSSEDSTKIAPIKAISLSEDKPLNKTLNEEMKPVKSYFNDNLKDSTVYFKLRSGIFGFNVYYANDKINITLGKSSRKRRQAEEEAQYDSLTIEDELVCKGDSLHYCTRVDNINHKILSSIAYSSDIEKFPFLDKENKYHFNLEGTNTYNDRFVYTISFTPKSRETYQGTMQINTENYAIEQIDYEYAKGKHGKNINLLGISHKETFERVKIIFKKDDLGYFPKYVYTQDHYETSIDRTFSLYKKQERFIGGKKDDVIKIDVKVFISGSNVNEFLVIKNTPINSAQFNDIVNEECINYEKINQYNTDTWKEYSIIEPTMELKKYKREVNN